VTATARKIAVLFYNAVHHGMEYVDPGASSYETRYRTRVVNNLHRRAKAFGFVLLQRQRANLCVQRLHVDSGLRYSVAAAGTENIGSSTLELGFPRRDLIGVV
jgi:hypothetical protein